MSRRHHPSGGVNRSKRVPAIAALFFICHSIAAYSQTVVDVITQDYRFQPQEVLIETGDSVRWLNKEKRTSHSIVFSDSTGGESERFFPNESWQRRFENVGTYPYQCGPHPEMTGVVIVKATSTTAPCEGMASKNEWIVRVDADRTGITIAQEKAPTKNLVLRPGLLPDVHYINQGRHALLATSDGWILRLDLKNGRQDIAKKLNAVVSSTATSTNIRGSDNLLAVASVTPGSLTILNTNLEIQKTIPVFDRTGRVASGLLRVRSAPARNSFVTLLSDVPELWEISYDPKAPEIGLGMVHDFQYREGHFVPGYLNPKRVTLPTLAHDFVLSDSGHEVLTVHSQAIASSTDIDVNLTHLDVRKTETAAAPRLSPDASDPMSLIVDAHTLPPSDRKGALRVNKETLRFFDAPFSPERQPATSSATNKGCVKQH